MRGYLRQAGFPSDALTWLVLLYRMTEVGPWIILDEHDKKSLEVVRKSLVATGQSTSNVVEHSALDSYVELALIFRHGKDKERLQKNFRNAVDSMLSLSSVPVRLHIVTDDESFKVAASLVANISMKNQKQLEVVHVPTTNIKLLTAKETSVDLLQDFFTSRANSYYKDPLFFFSLFLYDILPGLKKVILMDIDVRLEEDIADLHHYFSLFNDEHIMAMTHELSTAYLHALTVYRRDHPNTTLGSPHSEGGFPGYNSGVMLIDIERLKKSSILRSYLNRTVLTERCKYYSFRGDLGDQDLYTLVAFDHPQLFYTLPCGWNRQLCQWWRNQGYAQVFDKYFACEGRVKMYHGNCGSVIPEKVLVP
ncbi:Glycosyl transferase family 8 [Trinorchestia longiramus]|nr:Glycosyl transferase family 8 [Trinorchestia longiramus]